jgi:hypothetical protein
MKKNGLNKLYTLAAGLLLFVQSPAQKGFLYKAALDTVPQQGFYQVVLRPALAARLQPGLQDIRIADADGKQVPYILKSDIPAFSESRFKEMPIRSNKKENDKQTHVVIENNTGQALSELLLVIKNTDAGRTATLSGSDNNNDWYVIKENIALNHFFTTEGDHFIQALDFPNSQYKYFKIILNGKDLLPVNIVRAGIYEQSFINGRYMPLPAPRILQKDSGDKFSYIFLRFDDDYFIDRLELQVTGPRFYKRTLQVFSGSIGSAEELGQYSLRPDTPAILPVGVKTNHLLLKIQNDDNPPLHISSAAAFQLNKYLFTWLEKGKTYTLLFGDSTAIAPVYDLQYFKDSIGKTPALIAYGKITYNKRDEKQPGQTPKNNRIVIWLALGAVSIVLLLLTAKMARQINQREQ